jgi:hypothetical protein
MVTEFFTGLMVLYMRVSSVMDESKVMEPKSYLTEQLKQVFFVMEKSNMSVLRQIITANMLVIPSQ